MYIPHSDKETKEILSQLGLGSLEELFSHIDPLLLNPPCNLPEPRSEEDLRDFFLELGERNRLPVYFAGAGSYDRIVPSALKHLIQRGEFLTAYTPYQAEASQGTLQAIFEYQTVIAELTGMDVANASMYDGASALAEAVLMARAVKGRGSRIVLSSAVNPMYRKVVKTYLQGYEDEILEVGFTDEGTTDLNALEDALRDGSAHAVAIQYPNFFGFIEPLEDIGNLVKGYDVPFIVIADPVALSILRPPGDFGADIVVGEGQQLGIPMNFGGPYVGFFATKEAYIRKMPGRLVGLAEDTEGRRAFTLVLQTREQHIRRERATSNICTNQNLMALANLMYAALLGREGLKEVALQSLSKAFYLKGKLLDLGFEEVFKGKHLWEFPLRVGNADRLWRELLNKGYMFGVPVYTFYPNIKDVLLIAVTEKRKREEIDGLCEALRGLIQ
ncbi:glycine dehydrogenase (decarboxylating) alpha subunit [Hydrogenivirga caldilitoris]|uniref:Probable glycine dehydrogenase (decarboxylating) subunit 1 n=1 Tax=Hydrogenivirga caldilitoris TaxID=246264 RepID=A0A497XP13_9AQUI|nr:aminomethyl-transferring glycine dehydrogenase subunit GcvPA [Hydrogenivirga caldilitoris]RLJ69859.1 glycine dehydrogenase (decarboxylating) alpha subunit [Hydrogenivirga caldilitoris]